MVDRLVEERHLEVEVLDLSSPEPGRNLPHRLRKSICMVRRLLALADGIPTTVYQTLPGGIGIWNSLLEGVVVRVLGYRLVVHHHSYAYIDKPTFGMKMYRRLVAPQVDVVLSESMATSLCAVFDPRNVRVIDNSALLPDDFCESALRLVEVPISRCDDAPLALGQLSNLCVEKGSVELIEAARSLMEEGQNIALRLAGPMRDEETRTNFERLERDFPNMVEHVGPVSDWLEKLDFYRSLDLFVFPSKYKVEAQPAVIYEAAAAGTPILSTTVGTISAQLAVLDGRRIDPRTALADQIRVLCDDELTSALRGERRSVAKRFAAHRLTSQADLSSFVEEEFKLETTLPRLVGLTSNAESRLPRSTRKIVRLASKALRALFHPVSRRALRKGVAPAFEHRSVLTELEIGTVIDVGANRGQFALSALISNKDVRIVSFEPIPEAASVFEQIFAGRTEIDLRTMAIGSSPGRVPIHISASDDSSSLLPISDLQVRTFPGTEQRDVYDVEVSTLDIELEPESLEGPVLLKLDVQGFELEVLKGATQTLGRTDFVYCEVSFAEFYDNQPLASEIIDFLDLEGFSLSRVSQVTRDVSGSVMQADLLFERCGHE